MVGESRAEPQYTSDCLMEAMSDKAHNVSTLQYMCYFRQSMDTFFVNVKDCRQLVVQGKVVLQDKIPHHIYRYHKLTEKTLTLPGITKEQFQHNCSLLDWVIKLKDITHFQELYPQYVYSVNDEIKILKLMNNCNYPVK